MVETKGWDIQKADAAQHWEISDGSLFLYALIIKKDIFQHKWLSFFEFIATT